MRTEHETQSLLPAMMEARNRFMELVDEIRPELHRYCARMTGSVFDGEDVLQDTFAKAYYALGQMMEPPNMKPWLFRIAHNTAMDFLKRRERKDVDLVSDVPERAENEEPGVDPELVEAALSVFAALAPMQRAAIILKDVLGHSLEETAQTMGTTVGAVKAALSRARANIAKFSRETVATPARIAASDEWPMLERYVELFNNHDWNGLRALLAEESRVDIVSRFQRRVVDAGYYDRYAEIIGVEDIRAQAGWVDGRPAIAIFRSPSDPEPAYFILLETREGRISRIRDFRYVSYIASEARFSASGFAL